MKKLLVLLAMTAWIALPAKNQKIVKPTKDQVEWADKEIGVIIHFDIQVFDPTLNYHDKSTLPPASIYNPTMLDTDQWMEAIKKIGAKYAVLVAKHGTGFCLWPTAVHPYSVANCPYKDGKGDIVGEFVASCKKYGIKPGLYYNTNYNTYYGAGYNPMTDEARQAYNQVVYKQLREIWGNYGELFEIWFDGGVMEDEKNGIAKEVNRLLKEYQPHALLFQGPYGAKNCLRWVGNEKGHSPYPLWSTTEVGTSSEGIVEIPDLNGTPDGRYWIPAETDFPNKKARNDVDNGGGWLWIKNDEQSLYSSDELLERYFSSVGRNTNMLLGMEVGDNGLVPEADMKIYEEFGRKLQQSFSNRIGFSKGRGYQFVQKFDKPEKINQIVIQEDIRKGERILKYRVDALKDGNWVKVCDGVSVGHKRIQTFDSIEASSVRLTIEDAKARPVLRNFSTYYNDLLKK